MSCELCDRYHDLPPVYFIRVEAANIAIVGCPHHVVTARNLMYPANPQIVPPIGAEWPLEKVG